MARVLSHLPIDAALAPLREHLRAHRAAVLVASPGAGKTTRVPPALAEDGPVLVLQPRRAAARALARRVAAEQDWTLGEEVGWHVRFEPHFTAATRVLYATEGILTARLQSDPLLSAFRTIVLDEFHERSVHADLGLALARQAWLARGDLHLLVMSATIDTAPVAAYLDDCPVVQVPGDAHPLRVEYAPDEPLPTVVQRVLGVGDGDVLCFLPGAREIDDAARALRSVAGHHDVELVPLHGALPPEAQDLALMQGRRRRLILATNIAETSVTVPGVRTVIDVGLQKVARYAATRGLDTLQTERVPQDAADQRAGRAAREGPGVAVRLWHPREKLRPSREPEIARVDLAPVLLAILAWGGRPDRFEWFHAPASERVDEAMALLARLGAHCDGSLTVVGRRMARLAVAPRLARLIVEADAHLDACLLAAVLSDGRVPAPDGRTASSDLLSLLPVARAEPTLRRTATVLAREAGGQRFAERGALDEVAIGRAVLAGFPDRVAQRRTPHGGALLLGSGTGATLSPSSGVHDAEFLVALEVRGLEGREPVVHLASGVAREWLRPTHQDRRAWVDHDGRLRAVRQVRYDALLLHEAPDPLQPADHHALIDAWRRTPRSQGDAQWLARLAFAGADLDLDATLSAAAAQTTSLDGLDLEAASGWSIRQQLLTHAPARLALPSGRSAALRYDQDGGVRASVKLQELFGLAETPRIGSRYAPVVFELLAPNGRPVQTTSDLRSFWSTTYQDVRRELRARYPRHPWPEDPWTAMPTHRTIRR